MYFGLLLQGYCNYLNVTNLYNFITIIHSSQANVAEKNCKKICNSTQLLLQYFVHYILRYFDEYNDIYNTVNIRLISTQRGKFPENSHAAATRAQFSPQCLFKQVNDLCILSTARDGRADFINSGQISLSSGNVYYTLKSQRNHAAHPHAAISKALLKIQHVSHSATPPTFS